VVWIEKSFNLCRCPIDFSFKVWFSLVALQHLATFYGTVGQSLATLLQTDTRESVSVVFEKRALIQIAWLFLLILTMITVFV
jgi:hypothetical protein